MNSFFQFVRNFKDAFKILPIGVTEGQPIYQKPTFRNNVRQYYKRNEPVFSCLQLIADSCSQPKLVVRNLKKEILENHSLALLLEQPNPQVTDFDFISQTMIDLKLAGKAYWEKIRSNSGQVVELWRLRPDWVRPIPDRENFIRGYEYSPDGIAKEIVDPKDIIEFKLFDPENIYEGLAPISVLSRSGDVDNATVDFLKKFFDSGGMPAGFLTTDAAITETESEGIRKRWTDRYGGWRKWFSPAVLGKGAKYIPIGSNIKDMATEKIDDKTITRICMVLKVPPLLIGALIGGKRSTYNNLQQARESFWNEGMLPDLKRIQATLNFSLANEFSDVKIGYDFSGVPSLQEDKDKVFTRANGTYGTGNISTNEYREMIGFVIVPGGDEIPNLRVEPEPETIIDNDKSKKKIELLEFINKKAGFKTPRDEKDRLFREGETQKAVEKFFDGQFQRVKIEAGNLTKNEKSANDPFDDEFWKAEDDAFFAMMSAELLISAGMGVTNEANHFLSSFGIGIDGGLANNSIVEWVNSYSFDLVGGINNTTQKGLRKAIETWVQNDLPIESLYDDVAGLFGVGRSKTISITETTRAFFEGNRTVWRTSNLVKGWIWHTSADDRVCPDCGPRNGKFYPLESSTVCPAHPGGRCFGTAVFKDEGDV